MKDYRDVYFGKVLDAWLDFAGSDKVQHEEKKQNFAKLMGTDMDTLEAWLSGEKHMSTEDCLRACAVLEASPEDMMNLLPDDLYDSVTRDGDELGALVYAVFERVDKNQERVRQELIDVTRVLRETYELIALLDENTGVTWSYVDEAREKVRTKLEGEVEDDRT